MNAFIAECRRREIFKVAGFYVVGAWVVLQVASLAFDNWGLPTEAMRYLWIGTFLGSPIALILGWRYDLDGGRIYRTANSEGDAVRSLGRKDYLILSVATIAILALMGGLSASISRSLSLPRETQLTGDPSAFDKYLQGVELLERWDKDDNVEVAISLFHEALSLDPNFALAYAHLSDGLRIRYALGGDEAWLDEATEYAEHGVALDPESSFVQVSLGRIHAMRGNYDLAMAAMKRAVSLDPNDAIAASSIAGVYERLGRLDDADNSYRRALTLDPENLSIHYSYASFLADQSRFDDAIQHGRTVIRIAPDHYGALVNLGAGLADTGKFSEAITMYERANEIRPSYMAYSNLGTVYSRIERYSDAVDAYRKALEIDNTDWLAWGNLAFVYSWIDGMDQQAKETFERAIQLAETARQQSPRDPWVYSDLALYYAKTDQPALALQRVGTAITLSPESGEILAAAAEAHEIMGQRDNAIELVQRSLEFGFDRQSLRRNPNLSDLLADPRMQALP